MTNVSPSLVPTAETGSTSAPDPAVVGIWRPVPARDNEIGREDGVGGVWCEANC